MKTWTGTRKCPNCTAPIGWAKLWLWGPIWSKWTCKACGSRLAFDTRRRIIVAILQALVLGAILPPMLHGDIFPAVLGIPIWIMIWRCDSVILKPQEATP